MSRGAKLPKLGYGVFLDFSDAINRLGEQTIRERYGNLFDMYENITGVNPYKNPMQIFPASHYTMGGLWVDYNLMSTIPGLFVGGEANFSDHGANRLGASALMQGLSDGYFVLPATIPDYLAKCGLKGAPKKEDHPEYAAAEAAVRERIEKLMAVKGDKSPRYYHQKLGHIIWEKCGMARTREGLTEAIAEVKALREEFWKNVRVVGDKNTLNVELERAARVADFLEFAELLCLDARERDESCGGHFRLEHATDEGEAERVDEKFAHVGVWEYQGDDKDPVRVQEPLVYENVHFATRSYK